MSAAGAVVGRIGFPGREALLARVPPTAAGAEVAAALGLPTGRPVIVVNGGTEEVPTARADALRDAMSGVVTVARERGAILVTGGTDAGVFSLLGEVLGHVEGDYVCVGVAPAELTTWPGKTTAAESGDAARLEPHHSHLVVVEAARWGDETPAMMSLVAAAAAGRASVAVLAGGGQIAAQEVRAHLRAARPVIVLEGSGRLADRLAGIVRGDGEPIDELGDAAGSTALLEVCDVTTGSTALQVLLRHRLDGGVDG